MDTAQSKPKIEKSAPYFQEWLNSKVDPEIIDLNVKYVKGRTALEYLLGNAIEKMGEGQQSPHSQQYVTTPVQKLLTRYAHVEEGGWWCSGINILDKFKEAEWGCFKPDQPRLDNDGEKPIKYEHPPKTPTEIFALNVSPSVWQNISHHFECPIGKEANFWEWVINNPEVPLVITEGAKKAGALLTAGYAAIALPGINNGLIKREGFDKRGKAIVTYDLGEHLLAFCQINRQIVYCFDSDEKLKTQNAVRDAIARGGGLFKELGGDVCVMSWAPELGKGIDDVLAAPNGRKIVEELFEKAERLTRYIEKRTRKIKKYSLPANFLDFLRQEEIANDLTFNELTLNVELKGVAARYPEDMRLSLIDNFSIDISKDNFKECVGYLARLKAYDPVKDYLIKCHKEVTPVSLDNLATRYLGTTDPIYDRALKALLVGMVKRRFEPGCQFDYMGILQGAQGCRKSTFLRILGNGFTGKGHHEMKGPDPLMVWHRSWIHEVAEMDKWSKKQVSEIKDFITTREDNFRIPWGATPQDYPRRFGLFGTVNKLSFLRDETGERRFWVFQCPKGWKIPTDKLEKEVDGIWASVVAAYLAGASPLLTDTDEAFMTMANQKFKEEDTWVEAITTYCGEYETEDKQIAYTRNQVTVKDLLENCLNIPLQEHPRHQTKVSNILESLNFIKKGQVRGDDGKRRSIWETPQLQEIQNDPDCLAVETVSQPLDRPLDSPKALHSNGSGNSTFDVSQPLDRPLDSPQALDSNNSTQVQLAVGQKNEKNNNFSEKREDDLTERQALIAAIKEEQTRLEWSDANLKRNLQLSFPGRRSTNALSDEELSQFWESLTLAKPLSELKGHGKT